jgi:hypothetical protein
MHLPNSFGNPDKAGEAGAWLSDNVGGTVIGGDGRAKGEGAGKGVKTRLVILEKSTLEGFLVVFLLGITLSCSSSSPTDLLLFPPPRHSLG